MQEVGEKGGEYSKLGVGRGDSFKIGVEGREGRIQPGGGWGGHKDEEDLDTNL